MIQHNLVKNAIQAYFAAVEIHNKPNIPYRYETVTLLLTNAWELVLKAYVKKYLSKTHSIYENKKKTSKETIQLSVALQYVNDDINKTKNNRFKPVYENILSIKEYRNDIAHFYCTELEPCIFSLVACCALNFVEFVKESFNKDILKDDGLFIMPIGFKVPFEPKEFFSKRSSIYSSSKEAKHFLDRIINRMTSLKENGIEESIVLSYDVYINSARRPSNSDLLVQISSDENTIGIHLDKSYRLTNDPNAPELRISETEFFERYPLTCKDITDWCRDNISGFKADKQFEKIKKEIQANSNLSDERKLDPKKNYQKKWFYSDEVKNIVKDNYKM